MSRQPSLILLREAPPYRLRTCNDERHRALFAVAPGPDFLDFGIAQNQRSELEGFAPLISTPGLPQYMGLIRCVLLWLSRRDSITVLRYTGFIGLTPKRRFRRR